MIGFQLKLDLCLDDFFFLDEKFQRTWNCKRVRDMTFHPIPCDDFMLLIICGNFRYSSSNEQIAVEFREDLAPISVASYLKLLSAAGI